MSDPTSEKLETLLAEVKEHLLDLDADETSYLHEVLTRASVVGAEETQAECERLRDEVASLNKTIDALADVYDDRVEDIAQARTALAECRGALQGCVDRMERRRHFKQYEECTVLTRAKAALAADTPTPREPDDGTFLAVMGTLTIKEAAKIANGGPDEPEHHKAGRRMAAIDLLAQGAPQGGTGEPGGEG